MAGSNGAGPDRSQSRFFCNSARRLSLLCFAVAFGALVVGGVFAEVSSNGAPTSLETAIVRWIIVAGVVVGVIAYVIGGRIRAGRRL